MRALRRYSLLLAIFTLTLSTLAQDAGPSASPARFELANWTTQSSSQVKLTGESISATSLEPKGWFPATLPSTVLAALVSAKVYPDPYFGMNLRSIPGTTYPIGENFSNLPMPSDGPFAVPWWYRTEFHLPAGYRGKTIWLHFDGINYRANIWLNGKKIADAKDVAGTFRVFEFNVSGSVRSDQSNAVAVEVFAPGKDDLAITWVDWNPAPPDKNMGLWKPVYLSASDDVVLRHPFVSSKLAPDLKAAALTISAGLRNTSNHPLKGLLRAEVESIVVSQPVELGPRQSKTIRFTPEQFPQLRLKNPRLWWPYAMGEPHLYTAKLAFIMDGKISDRAQIKFGVREITSELTAKGHLLFRINGRKILIRGGGWASDMMLRWSADRIESELRYARDMGLNTIRLEGKLEQDEFFEMTDRMGILVMPGWSCCDAWERWDDWTSEQHKIAGASLKDQARRLGTHASVIAFLYGSDIPPPPDVEKMYREILKAARWPNPAISSASETPTSFSGPSGVKMTGPYNYIPPNYWLADKQGRGAEGFNAETGPGPSIPSLESLRRFLPADHLWPIDEQWNYHSGGSRFKTLEVFNTGLKERYGKPENLADYLRKSQAMAYEGERAMFEAYARNKYAATGVIQWMLNNAWPSLIWHLYDYYLLPAGGYFGTKKACESVHVQYSYDDNSVFVINGEYRSLPGLKVTARVYNLDATDKGSREITLDVLPDSSTKAFELPKVAGLTRTYLLRLQLHDASHNLLSDNFYWLSTQPDLLDWAKSDDATYTPQSAYADLRDLSNLPDVRLTMEKTFENQLEDAKVRVALQNTSRHLAFMVHVRLTKGEGGDEVVPVFWDDNYISLLPGEKRVITASYRTRDLGGAKPEISVDGWNAKQ